MSRRGRRVADDRPRIAWRNRILLALATLAATCLGVVWAGGQWRVGLALGAGAAVVVVGAIALAGTMPARRDDDVR